VSLVPHRRHSPITAPGYGGAQVPPSLRFGRCHRTFTLLV